jgi:hypothetical protein
MAGFDVQGEIDFWIGGPGDDQPGQIPQHALFMSLLLVEQPWKTDATNLNTDLETFRKSRGSTPLKDQAARAVELTMKLRAFLMATHDAVAGGKWLGWAYPLFIDHLRREGDFFIEKIANKEKEPTDTELCRILKFSAEHAAFAVHLLDPSETKKISEARVILGRFLDLGDCCKSVTPALVEMSARCEKELDAFFVGFKPKTQSIIHPLLAAHVVREGKRFIQIVDRLRSDALTDRIAALAARAR